jgi:hypothetical protein
LRVANRLAQRGVVKPEFRKRFSRTELEIVYDEVAFGGQRRGLLRTSDDRRKQDQGEQSRYTARREIVHPCFFDLDFLGCR